MSSVTTILMSVLVLGVLMLGGLAVYARLKPLPEARLGAQPGPHVAGVHDFAGGVKHVLPLSRLPQEAEAQLAQIILATERTVEHPTTTSGRAFVTRSALFGFPDITRIWVADGHLHIHGHLVIGRSDLGVNAQRVAGWVQQLLNLAR